MQLPSAAPASTPAAPHLCYLLMCLNASRLLNYGCLVRSEELCTGRPLSGRRRHGSSHARASGRLRKRRQRPPYARVPPNPTSPRAAARPTLATLPHAAHTARNKQHDDDLQLPLRVLPHRRHRTQIWRPVCPSLARCPTSGRRTHARLWHRNRGNGGGRGRVQERGESIGPDAGGCCGRGCRAADAGALHLQQHRPAVLWQPPLLHQAWHARLQCMRVHHRDQPRPRHRGAAPDENDHRNRPSACHVPGLSRTHSPLHRGGAPSGLGPADSR